MREKIWGTIGKSIVDYEKNNKISKMWKEPLVEIISTQDEQLGILKSAVSPKHLLPADILSGAKSIISFFIPFQDAIAASNIKGRLSSAAWVAAYINTNALIQCVNDNIELLLRQNGHAVGKIPATHNFDAETLISNWSHRHIAYIAGLGTFGINNMLITKNGCCGRFGSIITSYEFNAYPAISARREKCLHKINGSCGKCQKKCVAGAYVDNIFDRHKCYAQCLENMEHYKSVGYADICGKCLVGLPCSTKDPTELLNKAV